MESWLLAGVNLERCWRTNLQPGSRWLTPSSAAGSSPTPRARLASQIGSPSRRSGPRPAWRCLATCGAKSLAQVLVPRRAPHAVPPYTSSRTVRKFVNYTVPYAYAATCCVLARRTHYDNTTYAVCCMLHAVCPCLLCCLTRLSAAVRRN